jgi:hypothetical protein
VAIYDVANNNTELMCGGTIISPYLILSGKLRGVYRLRLYFQDTRTLKKKFWCCILAARCFVEDILDTKRKPEDFKIIVGRLTKNYYNTTNDEDHGKIYSVLSFFCGCMQLTYCRSVFLISASHVYF